MKLAYVVNLRFPTEKAYGYQVSKMCEEFSLAKTEVTLFYPERKNPISEDFFSFYRVQPIFNLKKVEGFDFFRWRPYIGRWSFYTQGLAFALRSLKLIKDKKTIIFSRNPEVIWVFSWAGFKTVFECHDWFGKNRRLSLFFLRRCSQIVTTNNFIRNEFIKSGFSNDKIITAPNGVNLEKFDLELEATEALARLDIDSSLKSTLAGRKILLYTGSFRTMGVDKGIDGIISALNFVLDKDVFFVAVGGDETDINFYQTMARDQGVSDKVLFLGRQTHDQLALWQKASTALMMPFPRKAHYEYFMTPLKMFEYMASKRPIVASDLPSIREILNEKNAVFCKPDDVQSLAQAINFILSNPGEAKLIAAQAYIDVHNYTWSKRAHKIIDFIRHD